MPISRRLGAGVPALVVCLASAPAHAQTPALPATGIVRGVVVDRADGTAIGDVSVRVQDAGAPVKTDGEGRFELDEQDIARPERERGDIPRTEERVRAGGDDDRVLAARIDDDQRDAARRVGRALHLADVDPFACQIGQAGLPEIVVAHAGDWIVLSHSGAFHVAHATRTCDA